MTLTELGDRFLEARSKLLDAGVPFDGWTAYISARDSRAISLQYPESTAFGYGCEVYGARWEIEPRNEVAPGEFRIVRSGRYIYPPSLAGTAALLHRRGPSPLTVGAGQTGKTITTHGWSADPGKDDKA